MDCFEQKSQSELLHTFFGSNFSVRYIDAKLSIFLWIIDSRKAIFAIVSISPVLISQAFLTEDSKLIDGLISMFLHYEELAKENDPTTSSST